MDHDARVTIEYCGFDQWRGRKSILRGTYAPHCSLCILRTLLTWTLPNSTLRYISSHMRIARSSCTVYAVVLYCIRTLPRGGMYWVVHPRRPRDFPRPERCPEGEARGPREILRSEGMYNPIHPDSRQCTAILSSLIHTKGCIRKYIPAWQVVLTVLKSILPC